MSDQDTSASPFEAIRHTREDGGEYWEARELAQVLGYTRWEQFPGVISKAQRACEQSGQDVQDHFREAPKLIATGKGAQRRVVDWELSRYACYLVVQNADPEKPIVALGQTYFAVQTRRAELAEEAALPGMTEDQQRLFIRHQLSGHNKQLAEAARAAGVASATDFATFQNHGYRGLYAGETAAMITRRKGLKRGQEILDHMGSTELAANLFRATQTEEKLRREGITGKAAANKAHHDMGAAVRAFIIEQGGTPPEELPTPAESIQQVERKEQQRLQAERQPSLFAADPSDDEA